MTEFRQAFYRSREEWNEVIEAAGFRRLKETDPASSSKASGHYNAAVAGSRDSKKQRDTRAYYAVYVPDPPFTAPPRRKGSDDSVFSIPKSANGGYDDSDTNESKDKVKTILIKRLNKEVQ